VRKKWLRHCLLRRIALQTVSSDGTTDRIQKNPVLPGGLREIGK
jgi:hypothetical protein